MVSVFDVAAYILEHRGPMTAMKLQKLCYYVQAWSCVWDERPLFEDRIEAWANGPVVPALYKAHAGQFELRAGSIPNDNPSAIDQAGIETVDAVLGHYADKSSQWLSDLTHQEPPWRDAREGLAPGERGTKEITHAAMAEYYESL